MLWSKLILMAPRVVEVVMVDVVMEVLTVALGWTSMWTRV
jgi:hypothetical protein